MYVLEPIYHHLFIFAYEKVNYYKIVMLINLTYYW